MKRKFSIVLIMIMLMSGMNAYATELPIPEDINLYENYIEELSAEDSADSSTESADESAESETNNIDQVEETSEDENEELSIENNVDIQTHKTIHLQIDTEFEFDLETQSVYLVQLQVPSGLTGSDGEEAYEIINLLKAEEFKAETDLDIYTEQVQLVGHVDGDNAFLYNIRFKDLEAADFFGDKVKNSGILPNPQDGGSYHLTVIVSENGNAEIKDANLAPKLSDDYKRIENGEYGESRAVEIEESLAEKEGRKPVQPDEPDITPNRNYLVIVAIVFVLLIIGGFSIANYIRRIRMDDDDE